MTTLLRRTDHTRMPWRNGSGSTLEVARRPEGAELDGIDWRISFARVAEDGPFSEFPGVDRSLTLVEGDWMRLSTTDPTGAERVVDLRPFEPFDFAGETAVDCEVPHPTTDLNVMTRRGAVGASVVTRRVHGPLVLEPPRPGTLRLVAVLDGHVEVDLAGNRTPLEPLDVLGDVTERLDLGGSGVVAVIDLDVHA